MFKQTSLSVATLVLAATCGTAMAGNNGNDKEVGKEVGKTSEKTVPVVQEKDTTPACKDIPELKNLATALSDAQSVKTGNGGFGLNMWATVVDRDGVVCAVVKTGKNRGDQWPGSRVISAQKANTANAFSLPTLALSTANLYSAVQPGGSLFGLQESNPVDTSVAYAGSSAKFGTGKTDPMVGKKIGGVNVFGGGLALYNASGTLVGGIGVSGDSSCADHNIAWRTRHALALDKVPGGVAPDKSDNIVFDLAAEKKSGWGHPTCNETSQDVNNSVLADAPLAK